MSPIAASRLVLLRGQSTSQSVAFASANTPTPTPTQNIVQHLHTESQMLIMDRSQSPVHQSTRPPPHPPVLVVPDPVSARPAELRCSRTQGLVQSCVSSGPSPQRCGTSHGYWTPPSTGCGAANALGPGPKVPLLVLENKCVDIAKPPNRLCRRLLTDHIANKTSLTD